MDVVRNHLPPPAMPHAFSSLPTRAMATALGAVLKQGPPFSVNSLARPSSIAESTAGRRVGMIHGRFQPFHRGHLEYLRGAARLSEVVFVGITNPDPSRTRPEAADSLRHLPEANPFTYAERLLMIDAVARDEGIRLHVVPFPISEPDLWSAYLPRGATHYLRLFSAWGGEKLDRLRALGLDVVVLDEGTEKSISGADVRAALRGGGEWEQLVPDGVAVVIRALGLDAALAER